MNYRLPIEFVELVQVASTYDVSINRHHTDQYDQDELIKYVSGQFDSAQFTIDDDSRVSVSYYNGPKEVYRVVKIKFGELGEICTFGKHMKVEKDYVILSKSEHEELTKKAEPQVEEISDDDKPIDLSEIPF